MKKIDFHVEYIDEGEESLILRIRPENEKMAEEIKEMLGEETRMIGMCGPEKILFSLRDVFYFEYMEGKVFAYFRDSTCSVSSSLEKIEQQVERYDFLRCSKSMILNMKYIDKFQSTIGNRIIATLSNGENVIISRNYAKRLRAFLKDE